MKNWEKLRTYFPITNKFVYLDNASMSPLPVCVLEAIHNFNMKRHLLGRDFKNWWEKVDEVREKVAKFIGATTEEIAFTESTTHGINIVAQGLDWQCGDNVIINDLEFPANIYPWLNLQKRNVEIRVCKNVNGILYLEKLVELIDKNTKLIAISHVQASNGFRININLLGEICAKNNIFLLVDAIQSLGAFPVNVKNSNVHFLCAAAFKWLLGPDGVGLFYCNKGVLNKLNLTYLGWAGMKNRDNFASWNINLPNKVRRFELGNPNFSAIFGLAAALDFINEIGIIAISKRIVKLINFLNEKFSRIDEVIDNSNFAKCNLGGLIVFDVLNKREVHYRLTKKGYITALRHNGIRVSPHFYNTLEELDAFVKTLKCIISGKD